jgi:hypothetical protein
VEKKIRTVTWFEFCQIILDRFGKEHHELLIRQLFHIKQLSSVAEYVERFSELVDQLTAYESRTDPLYYTMRFIDGLQYELRSAVLIQRPPDLDTACVLALLQEEVTAPNRNRGFRKTESLPSSKFVTRNPLPLPPTPRVDSSGVNAAAEQVRGHPQDDKWAALRAFRRAKGLCVKCAEKWSPEHKCPPSAQLNAIKDLWDLFQLEDTEENDQCVPGQDCNGQLFVAVSEATFMGKESSKTMQLVGSVQGKETLILIDSRSSRTFISTKLAASLSGVKQLDVPVNVPVATGGNMQCSTYIPGAALSIQGCSFRMDMKVLPLSHYDIIVGMDWLESFSPMKVHWRQKWMLIPYLGTHSLLQGLGPEIPEGSVVEVSAILATDKELLQVEMPPDLVELLDEFHHEVFDQPKGLPPSRPCDHTIPLVEGATPVSVRPYRYPPAIKDEIERQIIEMLKDGIIQHSTSPFSSYVLLVKKKDNS